MKYNLKKSFKLGIIGALAVMGGSFTISGALAFTTDHPDAIVYSLIGLLSYLSAWIICAWRVE